MTDRTTSLTDGEGILLRTMLEPFVFMPDGLLEPLSLQRMRDLWWAANVPSVAEPEPA